MRNYQLDPSLGCVGRQKMPHGLTEMQRLTMFQRPSATKTSSGVGALKSGSMATALPIHSGFGESSAPIRRSTLLQLQHTHGNRFVQRMLQLDREPEGESAVAPDVERTIESTRGGGNALDSSAQGTMGKAFNADFSAVRVHTNTQADTLNQSLNARAFTTGQDIYFKQGEYNPGSSSGKELLAHELTHVVQQNGDKVQGKYEDESKCPGCVGRASGLNRSIQTKLSVNQPGDVYEQEADRAGQAYAKWEQQSSPAAGGGQSVGRQAIEEEKKEETPMMAKFKDGWLLRQAEAGLEEEELVQSKLQKDGVQRQAEEEEQMP